MKFSIQSQEVNNNWYHKPDLKISDVYPFLKSKITATRIVKDDKGYTINIIELENLEDLIQLIEKLDCIVVVANYSNKSVEFNQYDIKGKIIVYDDYLED